jgi:uncharacterized protein
MKTGKMKGTIQRETGLGKITEGKYYVYELRYPNSLMDFGRRAGGVFYVGKGTRNRMMDHERETRRLLDLHRYQYMKHKHKVIVEIWDAGQAVVQEIVYRTDDEEEAYEVESSLIKKYGLARLSNATYGRRPKIRKRRNPRAA